MEFVLYEDMIAQRSELSEVIMEVTKVDAVQNFTVTKDKLQLPKKGESNKGMFTPFLNTSIRDIAYILTNEHPKIVNFGSSYKGYY